MQSLTRRALTAAAAGGGGKYAFFEDMYPLHAPAPRYATYEEQQYHSPTVRCLEVRKQLTETEKLQHLHDWHKEPDGIRLPPEYGWTEDWGPEPGEEGHNAYYLKNRMYMSSEEKSKYDLRVGVPVEKNSMRHQEMPFHKRMKAAYSNLQERGDPQYHSPRARNYWTRHSYEDQRDTVAVARDDFLQEWLDKPGVTSQNVAQKIGEYNGTAKGKTVKSVQRRPEWQLPPPLEEDDD